MSIDKKTCFKSLFGIIPFAFLLGFDVTGVSVALTEIQNSFTTQYSVLQWVLSAYLVIYGGMSLLPGRFGDVLGLRRVYLIGGVTFFIGAVISALSPSVWYLIAGRAIQGLGAAMLAGVGVGMIGRYFKGKMKAAALSAFLASASLGTVTGPVLGGVIQNSLGWHGIFWIMAIYSLVFYILSIFLISKKMSEKHKGSLHIFEGIILCLGLIGFLIWLNLGQYWSWYSHISIGLITVVGILLFTFVWMQNKNKSSLIDMDIFFSRNFIATSIAIIGIYISFTCYFLFLPIFFIHVKEIPLEYVGMHYVPLTLGAFLAFMFGSVLRKYFSVFFLVSVGFAVMIITNALLAYFIAANVSYLLIASDLFLFGVSAGIAINFVINAYMRSIPSHCSGTAGGILSSLRFISGAIGIIIFTMIFLQFGESDFLQFLVHNGYQVTPEGIKHLDLLFSGLENSKAFSMHYASIPASEMGIHIKGAFADGLADTVAIFTVPLLVGFIAFVTFFKKKTGEVI